MASEELKAKIGVGIVTYKRPDFFKVAHASVLRHLSFVDELAIYHDGPLVKGYPRIPHGKVNRGVGYAKNKLFKDLLKRGCRYIFIMEDDMEILDRMAVVGYLAAAKMTGMGHLLFAHHGPGNRSFDNLIQQDGPLQFYEACVGSWCFYLAEDLKRAGLMDEEFENAWEHVEHTRRIMQLYNVPYGYYPDVVGSREWIREQPGAIEHSSIGSQEDPVRLEKIIAGLHHWQEKDPNFPAAHTLSFYLEERERLAK